MITEDVCILEPTHKEPVKKIINETNGKLIFCCKCGNGFEEKDLAINNGSGSLCYYCVDLLKIPHVDKKGILQCYGKTFVIDRIAKKKMLPEIMKGI